MLRTPTLGITSSFTAWHFAAKLTSIRNASLSCFSPLFSVPVKVGKNLNRKKFYPWYSQVDAMLLFRDKRKWNSHLVAPWTCLLEKTGIKTQWYDVNTSMNEGSRLSTTFNTASLNKEWCTKPNPFSMWRWKIWNCNFSLRTCFESNNFRVLSNKRIRAITTEVKTCT